VVANAVIHNPISASTAVHNLNKSLTIYQ